MEPSATTTTDIYSFQELKYKFHICATDISTATGTSTSKGMHLNNPVDSDASKPGQSTSSAESSGNQKIAATQRAADIFCNNNNIKMLSQL